MRDHHHSLTVSLDSDLPECAQKPFRSFHGRFRAADIPAARGTPKALHLPALIVGNVSPGLAFPNTQEDLPQVLPTKDRQAFGFADCIGCGIGTIQITGINHIHWNIREPFFQCFRLP